MITVKRLREMISMALLNGIIQEDDLVFVAGDPEGNEIRPLAVAQREWKVVGENEFVETDPAGNPTGPAERIMMLWP